MSLLESVVRDRGARCHPYFELSNSPLRVRVCAPQVRVAPSGSSCDLVALVFTQTAARRVRVLGVTPPHATPSQQRAGHGSDRSMCAFMKCRAERPQQLLGRLLKVRLEYQSDASTERHQQLSLKAPKGKNVTNGQQKSHRSDRVGSVRRQRTEADHGSRGRPGSWRWPWPVRQRDALAAARMPTATPTGTGPRCG